MDSITVNIFGENYTVKSGEDRSYIEEVARFVDMKMKEISGSGKAITTDKVAILTALNIADEFYKSRREWADKEKVAGERIGKLLEALKKAVND